MARLDSPVRKDLSRSDFEQYPVWTWTDDKEGYLPLSEADPSPEDYEGLFIKARFEADGHSFDGYLIGDETYFAFGLFIDGRSFIVNLNLPDLIDQDLVEICKVLKIPSLELLPIRYRSTVRLKDGPMIGGTLAL